MILIGLGNKARHGKDTAASAILDHAKRVMLPTLKVSWADALRQETNDAITAAGSIEKLIALGVDEIRPMKPYVGEVKNGYQTIVLPNATMRLHWEFPKWVVPTPDAKPEPGLPYGKHSKLLQWWGTEYRRAQDPNYWVKKGRAKIQDFERKYPNGVVCISDTRFVNEALAVEDLGGYTMNVTRLNGNGTVFVDESRDPNHVSETQLDDWNWHYRIFSKEVALTAELAITHFEYIRALRGL